MRIKLMITLVLIGLNSTSQDTITDSRSQLELISEELNISESQAYSSLVKQQKIQAYRNLMIYLTMVIGIIGMNKSISRLNKDKEEYTSIYGSRTKYKDSWVFITILFSVIFIVSLIYNSIMLADTFTGLFNPEYGALEQLQFIKK